MTFKVESIADLVNVAKVLHTESADRPIILFNGPLGSGKTTLIRLLMEQVDSKVEVTSPTYSLVQIYNTSYGPYYHFDLYRINETEELLDFGFDEYIDSGNPCLIEWPDIGETLLPESGVITVNIAMEEGHRVVSIT